jgi:hypothetical protein
MIVFHPVAKLVSILLKSIGFAFKLKPMFFFCFFSLSFGGITPVFSSDNINKLKVNQCANDMEVEGLTWLLLDDLPGYANRVIQRSNRKHGQLKTIPTFIITAGKPEFEPLSLSVNQSQFSQEDMVKQVFFTTLERRYLNDNKLVEVQNYYWLLLTPTDKGWYMVMVFSRLGNSLAHQSLSPPQDNSNGIIGQAIKLWLRDCRAYSIFKPKGKEN